MKLTEMQEFGLKKLKEKYPLPLLGSELGDMWCRENGRSVSLSSRRSFGTNSAGWRTLRALEEMGLARVKYLRTPAGYLHIEYFWVP